MKLNGVYKEEHSEVMRLITEDNIHRFKYLVLTVILFELFMVVNYYVTTGFITSVYLLCYWFLLTISAIAIVLLKKFKKHPDKSRYKYENRLLLTYYWLFLMWGVIVSLLDQQSYGHISAYLTNLLATSIIFHISYRKFIALHVVPLVTLIIGIFVLQSDETLIFGHIINLTAFVIFCTLGSMLFFNGFTRQIEHKNLLERANVELEHLNQILMVQSSHDELTKLANRRGVYNYLEKFDLKNQKLTVAIFDVDGFKKYNDVYGHLKGDEVLQQVAAVLQKNAKENNHFAARFGGEEFIYIMVDEIEENALDIVNHIRTSIRNLEIEHSESDASPFVTVSAGITFQQNASLDSLNQILQKADVALYLAKKSGRNQAVVYQDTI